MFGTLKDDIVFELIVEHKTIVSVTETFSKMVSMLCQNGEQFLVKKLKILYTLDHTILFKFHQHVGQILIK